MSYIRAFLSPDHFFRILMDLQKRHPFVTTLRRFEAQTWRAGQEVVDLTFDTSRYFNENGFSQTYLTHTKKPKHSQDWSFFSDASDELIEIVGGRRRGLIVELTEARLLRQGPCKAKPLFEALRRAIGKSCNRGLYAAGTFYKDIYYHPEVADLELRASLDDSRAFVPAKSATPIS